MSKKNGVGKLYDRLTPEERFRLDVEAMARGDAQESELLTSTCPRRTYTMTDVGYSGRWDGAIQLTMATLMDLRQSTAKLRMVDAFRTAVLPYAEQLAQNSAAEAYFEASGAEDDSSEAGVEEDLERIEARVEKDGRFIPELLERLEGELATEGLAVWQAFSLFCEEDVGISPEKLLRATFPPALKDVGWFRQLCERLQLEAEAADVEEYRRYMRGHWRRRFGT
jgi:hypothetical protein